jgi:hypothetical protein
MVPHLYRRSLEVLEKSPPITRCSREARGPGGPLPDGCTKRHAARRIVTTTTVRERRVTLQANERAEQYQKGRRSRRSGAQIACRRT